MWCRKLRGGEVKERGGGREAGSEVRGAPEVRHAARPSPSRGFSSKEEKLIQRWKEAPWDLQKAEAGHFSFASSLVPSLSAQ